VYLGTPLHALGGQTLATSIISHAAAVVMLPVLACAFCLTAMFWTLLQLAGINDLRLLLDRLPHLSREHAPQLLAAHRSVSN
jgi:hypothetical protein